MSIVLVLWMYLIYSTTDQSSTDAIAKDTETKKYAGKVYVAGMGGHFAEAEVVIDPSASEPLVIKDLGRYEVGGKDTHPIHDIRIDSNDRTKIFWSTYKTDLKAKGKVLHVGMTDLSSAEVVKDQVVEVPDRAYWTGAMYCASGQTKDSYIPVTMSNDGYIDVFEKGSLKLKHRVFLDSIGFKNNYQFFHGTNSPDLKSFVITANMTKEWVKPDEPAERLGKIDIVSLDLAALEKGELKVRARGMVTGSPQATISFRQSFTPDGKYLLQSGADRFFLIRADDMKLVDEEMMTDGENHDVISTPDGRYAVLTLRTKMPDPENPKGAQITDGAIQLYDIQAQKLVGKAVSVCYSCHKDMIEKGKDKTPAVNAALCGVEANWNM